MNTTWQECINFVSKHPFYGNVVGTFIGSFLGFGFSLLVAHIVHDYQKREKDREMLKAGIFEFEHNKELLDNHIDVCGSTVKDGIIDMNPLMPLQTVFLDIYKSHIPQALETKKGMPLKLRSIMHLIHAINEQTRNRNYYLYTNHIVQYTSNNSEPEREFLETMQIFDQRIFDDCNDAQNLIRLITDGFKGLKKI